MRFLCLAISLLVLALPAAVHSAVTAEATLYVDNGNPACTDAGTGTVTQPFCTIEAAATVVSAGQTVQVSSGTYAESVTVPSSGTATAPITFAAASGATPTVTGSANGSGFYMTGRSYVTVQGFTVTGARGDGIVVKNSSNVTVANNHISFSGQPANGKTAKGIRLDNATDSMVSGNTVDHNSSYGIYLTSGSTRNTLKANVIFNNAFGFQRAASGIRVFSSPGNTVSSNISHDNEDSGMEFDKSDNNLAINNVSYDNGDHGIDNTNGSVGTRIIANTVYKNVTAGINVEGTSTGVTLANNIGVDNGIASPRTHSNIRVESGSTSGTTMDYELVFLTTPDTLLIWNSVAYTSLAAFKSATGQEAHGIQGNPSFANVVGRDFHLAAGSPAIDSANSGASGQPSTDVEGNPRSDDPRTPNTGVGPRTYDDRGAYEFNAVPLDHIVISPASASIVAGASQTFTAQGFDINGASFDITASTTFSISPDGSCTGNVCTTTTAGPHTVTGSDAGKTSTASLTVTPGALDHLVLAPASATISSGGSRPYTAEGRDQYDNSLGDVTSTTTFSITPNGSCTGATCTAAVAGAHTVTGTKSGKTGTASLTVTAGTLDHIVISPSSATISAGASQAYTAEGFDAAGNSVGDVTAFTTFLISPNGTCAGAACTATAAGPHTVTGNDGGRTSTASLTVTAGVLDHLVLAPASATISAGGSQAYTAQGRDQYNNSLGDVTASTTFSIAPDGSCTGATCTASVAGAHTVTGNDGGKTGTASLTVTAGSVLDHIVISPSSATISAGGSQSYTAQGFDASNNSLGDVTASTTFSITPDGSCSGNACTATVAGPHTVTGNDGGRTSTASLTVIAGPLDHLALSPASATISAGGSQAYIAQGRDQYNNSLGDVTASTTFSIAPDGSCTGATCTASVAGAHTVTGNDGGKTGTASLQVGAGSLDHIVISPSSATISAGGSQSYTAQGFDASNNSIGDVTAFTTFSIAPEGSCTGSVCTANAGGSHTVTGNDGGKTATASLTVSFVRNPGFETDLSGWNTSGSGANITLTRVSGGHTGNWAAKLTNTGSTASTFATLQDSPNWVATTSAGTYTGSMWVRSDTAGAVFKLKFQEYTGSTLVASLTTQATLTTSWQQVTLTYTIRSPGSTLDFQAYVSSPAPGTAFYADDASIVLG